MPSDMLPQASFRFPFPDFLFLQVCRTISAGQCVSAHICSRKRGSISPKGEPLGLFSDLLSCKVELLLIFKPAFNWIPSVVLCQLGIELNHIKWFKECRMS